jgi:hypothetical protein
VFAFFICLFSLPQLLFSTNIIPALFFYPVFKMVAFKALLMGYGWKINWCLHFGDIWLKKRVSFFARLKYACYFMFAVCFGWAVVASIHSICHSKDKKVSFHLQSWWHFLCSLTPFPSQLCIAQTRQNNRAFTVGIVKKKWHRTMAFRQWICDFQWGPNCDTVFHAALTDATVSIAHYPIPTYT